MPTRKLPPISLRETDEAGHIHTFECEVSVTDEGEFRSTVPELLVPCVRAILNNDDEPDHRAECVLEKLRVNTVLKSSKLSDIKAVLRQAICEYVQQEIERERIIVYGVTTRTSYFKNARDQIFPNGGFPDAEYGKGGQWHGNAGNTSDRLGVGQILSNYYLVGFVARVYDKVTSKRGSYSKFTLEVPPEYHMEYSEPGARLNGFTHLDISADSLDDFTVIPYSDDAAEFFYRVMLSLCRLSDRINTFFSDPAEVEKAILAGNTGNNPLSLAPPANESAARKGGKTTPEPRIPDHNQRQERP